VTPDMTMIAKMVASWLGWLEADTRCQWGYDLKIPLELILHCKASAQQLVPPSVWPMSNTLVNFRMCQLFRMRLVLPNW